LIRSTIFNEFMMFLVQCTRNSSKKQKPPTHQGGGFNPPAEIYLVSFLTTHRRELSFPIKGTLALHCQVARLVSEPFLMLVRIVSGSRPSATKICVIANGRLSVSEMGNVGATGRTNKHFTLKQNPLNRSDLDDRSYFGLE
jgi:hypothetical protein